MAATLACYAPGTLHQRLHAAPACPATTLTSFEDVAAYVKTHGQLPPNFIQKKDARMLGWNPSRGNLQRVAPCKSIGGDRFSNREKRLPVAPGRVWYEADIDYHGGRRGPKRLLYSSDGLLYRTVDHYQTFQKIE